MSLRLTTLSRLALLILLVCLTSSVSAENSPRQSNNPATALSPGNSAVSNPDHLSNADAEASLCLTGLCPSGVWALCEYNGDLYAGGYFTSADGQTAKYIARWDGSQWHDVGGGMNHYVYDLLVYDGKLIAGGVFDTVNGEPMGHVAAWDGVSWTPLGEGINRRPGIYDMIEYGGDAVAGGYYATAEGRIVCHIAAWDGDTWRPLTAREGMPLAKEFDNNQTAIPGAMVSVPVTRMKSCLFDENHVVTGGAIASSGTGAPSLANSTFVANSADGSGGGLYAVGAVPSVTNCIFAFGIGSAMWAAPLQVIVGPISAISPFASDLLREDGRHRIVG